MHQIIQVHKMNQVHKVIQIHKVIQVHKVNQVHKVSVHWHLSTSKVNIGQDRLFSGCVAVSRMAAVKHKTPSAQERQPVHSSHNREWLWLQLGREIIFLVFFRPDGPAGRARAGEQEWESSVGKSCTQGWGRGWVTDQDISLNLSCYYLFEPVQMDILFLRVNRWSPSISLHIGALPVVSSPQS